MAGADDLRIANVTVSRLFGVPNRLDVSFVPVRSDCPVSAIIFGENGSGKSSIAKAIEWTTQNRINRSSVSKRRSRSSLINASNKEARDGWAAVTLSDGTELRRQAIWDEEDHSFRFQGPEPLADFMRSPLVLTRADVLAFINNPPSARGKVFLDFALGGNGSTPDSAPAAADTAYLDQEILALKGQIRAAAVPIAEHLGRPRPYDLEQIAAMVDDLYKGVPTGQRHRIRIPRQLEPAVTLIEELQKQAREVRKTRDKAQRLAGASAPRRIAQLKEALVDVDDWLTDAFRKITASSHVEKICIDLGVSSVSALDIRIEAANGASFGERILSEGYQDLLAMLFFLATARATTAQGQVRVLVLDDVLQSVDAHIRVALMQFILREFKQWQLIVTVHDRLWREQLQKLFQDAGMPLVGIELHGWTFAAGSNVSQALRDPSAALRTVMTTRDPAAVCALAGRLLEQICDVLSWTIPVRVQRRRDDRYTLEDLWPGVKSALCDSEAAAAIQQTEGLRHLRNLVGAHHNEWALSVTLSEANRFAAAVLDLFGHTWCSACTGWVQHAGHGVLRCGCGNTELTRVKRKV